jgi:hypothetical protein
LYRYSVDVTIERDLATVTVLETVANGATLLATQAYERRDVSAEGGGGGGGGESEWVLRSHFTIPCRVGTSHMVILQSQQQLMTAVTNLMTPGSDNPMPRR